MMTSGLKKILIVGCGPGSEAYITPAARAAALTADVLIVSRRLAHLFPECPAERVDSGTDVPGALAAITKRRDAGLQVVVLATGDPGIASLAQPVIRHFGRENCEVIPGISSVQAAFARLGLDWQEARIVSAHYREPGISATDLQVAEKIAVLGGHEGAVRWVAALLPKLTGDRRVFVCEDLTLPGERIREADAASLRGMDVSARAILLIIKAEVLT
jgi:precorrin-6y C5,15-methyltransferase (decarboxylating) CbiE subunit